MKWSMRGIGRRSNISSSYPFLCHWSPSIPSEWKSVNFFGFIMFSGGIERDGWHKIGWNKCVAKPVKILFRVIFSQLSKLKHSISRVFSEKFTFKVIVKSHPNTSPQPLQFHKSIHQFFSGDIRWWYTSINRRKKSQRFCNKIVT